MVSDQLLCVCLATFKCCPSPQRIRSTELAWQRVDIVCTDYVDRFLEISATQSYSDGAG
jgi:hypothetical protein